jgi:hypothetical protein
MSPSYAWLKSSLAVSKKNTKELTLNYSHLKLSQHLSIRCTSLKFTKYFSTNYPDWTKVLIPVTILSSYRRWIDVGYSTWDITPDEDSHIIVVYLDRAKNSIYLFDPNNSFKRVEQKSVPHEDRKIFNDILITISKTFQNHFSVPPFTIQNRAVPSQDGYCGIIAIKVCEDIFKTEE